MSDARPKFTGIKHTATVADLIAVFIFSLPILAPARSPQTIGTVE
jgi:hypothetical protein